MPFCCGDDDDNSNMPQGYTKNRSCTDCLCALLFLAFWGGYIAVAGVAYANGKPERLIYGTDYLGYRCGDEGNVPPSFSTFIPSNSTWQSATWTDNKLLWYPLPYTSQDFSLTAIANSAICVKTCPTINATILNDIVTNGADMSAYTDIVRTYLTVSTYGGTTIDGVTTFAPARQYVMYGSSSFFHRCVPSGLTPALLNQTLQQLPGYTQVSSFFFRGFAETAAAWRVFLITWFLAFVICFVFAFLMKFILKPLVYLAIFLGFCFLVLLGAICWNRYNALLASGDTSTENERYVIFYKAMAIISWVASGLYLVLLFWMRKRIALACALINISGRVMSSSPSLLAVPLVIALFLMAVCAWALGVGVYLYSSDDFVYQPQLLPVFNASQSDTYGTQNGYVSYGSQLYANATVKVNQVSFTRQQLCYYDLFGFLWSAGFVSAIGYMIISSVTVQWYFSDLDDAKKAVPSDGIRTGVWWTLRYHLGTLAFGSLIIAIIQFIRIMMNYLYKQSQALKENQAAKVIFCIANCIIACFERIVKVISKNAYTMTAITGRSFCFSARDSFEFVVDNALTLFLLNAIVDFVILLGKFVVIAASVLIAYLLMKYNNLAAEASTYIFPLILIAFGSYFIAALYFGVYSVVVDANFVCYSYDRKANAGRGLYYVPAELEDQISNYSKEARLNEMQAAQKQAHAPSSS